MDDFLNTEEEDFGWSDENELVTQYENMMRNQQSVFFDVDDYQELYFYYMNFYADVYFISSELLAKGRAVLHAALAQYPNAEILQLLQTYHLYIENRITRVMLLERLEKLPPPKLEQEHFLHVLAHIYRQIGEPNKAFSLFSNLLENTDLEEDRVILYYEIMMLYEMAENAHQVLECCQNILKTGTVTHEVLFGEMYEYFFLKPIALPVFELLTKQYTFSMYAWLYLGKTYADIMLFDESVQALNYAVAISNHPMPLILLGRILAIADKPLEAFDCLQEALQRDPAQVGLYTEMGELLYSLDDTQRAMHFFTLAIDANNNDINALLGMALALSSLERYDDSIAYIMRAKKIDALSLEAWLLLADDYIEVNRDNEAVEIFQQLAKQYPKDVDIWLSYSNYYAMVEDFEQACTVAKQGLAILQGNPYLLYRIANYCFLGGDISQGITYLRLAIHTNSHYITFFVDYDENVMQIPEVAEIIHLLKGE